MIESRVIRYRELRPCTTAFIDTQTPGSNQKENFTIIGPGVSENSDQFVHMSERHGFNIGAARQPKGCKNSQHSHETAEVFVVHTGSWRLLFGHEANDGSLDIYPGDVVSVPTRMFRGFEKLDEGTGFLWVVLGGDDPGRVLWAPAVIEEAAEYGLTLMKDGTLINTADNRANIDKSRVETPCNQFELDMRRTPHPKALASCVARPTDWLTERRSVLSSDSCHESAIIGSQSSADGFGPGIITGWWDQPFQLRALKLRKSGETPKFVRNDPDVYFLHKGHCSLEIDNEVTVIEAGDTITVPVGCQRKFTAHTDAVLYNVIGNQSPQVTTIHH